MKFIYRCGNCGAQREFKADGPSYDADVEFHRLDAGGSSTPRRWIRHPCETGIHGIANLVAIVEDAPIE